MFHFTHPIWLWAATGIIVPVIIHLWNVREGKTLKVGSIAFLTESAKSHAKSFKLSDLLLLLLRFILLIVLGMLAAGPYLLKQADKQKDKGWLLIDKNEVNRVYQQFKPLIDTLLKGGYSFHYFNPGFKEENFAEVLKVPDTTQPSTVSYWKLLKELDQKVTSALPVHLFTDNDLARFSGDRPTVAMDLHWHTYTSTDTILRYIKKAYTTADDSIRVIVGNSSPVGTYYTHQSISPANNNTRFTLKVIEGKLYVGLSDSLPNEGYHPVPVDTSAVVVVIYASRNTEDANYVRAAIRAVKDFTKRQIKVSVVDAPQRIPATYNWLFWLSEESIPAAFIKNNVFAYESGKVNTIHSMISTNAEVQSSLANNISLYKSIAAKADDKAGRETIWRNGFGSPVLSLQKKGGFVYRFYSRLNPQWNDLVWSSQFPEIVYNLIFPGEDELSKTGRADKRIIDTTQIQPVIVAGEAFRQKQDLTEKKDLLKMAWLLAFVLFIVERILSQRLKKEEVYG